MATNVNEVLSLIEATHAKLTSRQVKRENVPRVLDEVAEQLRTLEATGSPVEHKAELFNAARTYLLDADAFSQGATWNAPANASLKSVQKWAAMCQ